MSTHVKVWRPARIPAVGEEIFVLAATNWGEVTNQSNNREARSGIRQI